MTASAQEQHSQTETVFNPHWFVQVQGGAQYTLGEISFGDLISPNVQVSGGYNFTKLFGLRLSVNAWQSKAGGTYNIYNSDGEGYEYSWKWNYVNPNVDAILNISNLIAGYNPNRLFNVSAFVGLGANIAFNNGEAKGVKKQIISLNKPYSIGQKLTAGEFVTKAVLNYGILFLIPLYAFFFYLYFFAVNI
jgi:hypothetical protein